MLEVAALCDLRIPLDRRMGLSPDCDCLMRSWLWDDLGWAEASLGETWLKLKMLGLVTVLHAPS